MPEFANPRPVVQPSLLADDEGCPYVAYSCRSSYVTDYGLLQMPIASADEDAGSALVRVHAPVQHRVVTIHAVRDGKEPEIPDPEDEIGPNEVLARTVITPSTPTPLANARSWRYEIAAAYYYLPRKVRKPSDGFPGGAPPMAEKPNDPAFLYTPDMFSDALNVTNDIG